MTRIDEIRKRLEAATLGPWTKHGDGDKSVYHIKVIDKDERGRRRHRFIAACSSHGCNNKEDAEFIANAPEDIRFLLDRVKELEDLLSEWHENNGCICDGPTEPCYYCRTEFLLHGRKNEEKGNDTSNKE